MYIYIYIERDTYIRVGAFACVHVVCARVCVRARVCKRRARVGEGRVWA